MAVCNDVDRNPEHSIVLLKLSFYYMKIKVSKGNSGAPQPPPFPAAFTLMSVLRSAHYTQEVSVNGRVRARKNPDILLLSVPAAAI